MTTKYDYRHPTTEELYALEVEARRLRAEAVSDLVRNVARRIKGHFTRPAAGARGLKHA